MFLGVLDANGLLTRLWAVCEIKSRGWQFDAASRHLKGYATESFIWDARSIICMNRHHRAFPSHSLPRLKYALCFPLFFFFSLPLEVSKSKYTVEWGNKGVIKIFICVGFISKKRSYTAQQQHTSCLNIFFQTCGFSIVPWCVILNRKYEAIHPEFNGAGMPLKHFIVHYMKGRGHWVDICCALGWIVREPLQQQQKNVKIYHHISFSPCTRSLLAHAYTLSRSVPVGGQNHFLIHATLHNASLHCVGYRQCTSSHKVSSNSWASSARRAACSPNPQSAFRVCVDLFGPETWEQAPAGEDPCSYRYRSASRSKKLFQSDEQARVSDRFLSRSELKMFGTSSLALADRELTYKVWDCVNSFGLWRVCKPPRKVISTTLINRKGNRYSQK